GRERGWLEWGACAVCHDGKVTGDEQCDAGSAIADACCDSSCRAEPGCEIEPNDTAAQAFPLAVDSSGHFELRGWIAPAGDVDRYSFVIPAGYTATIAAETHAFVPGDTCTGGGDSYLEVHDAQDLLVGADDGSGWGAGPHTPV